MIITTKKRFHWSDLDKKHSLNTIILYKYAN